MTETEPKRPEQNEVSEEVPTTIGAFLLFVLRKIIRRKKFLLIPLWILLVTVALLILLGGGSSILPVIYIGF